MEKTSYLTILKSNTKNNFNIDDNICPVNKFRIFNHLTNDTEINSQLNTTNSVINIIRQIRGEFQNKFDENFIIESLMKLSDDVESLRIYLSNPVINYSKNIFFHKFILFIFIFIWENVIIILLQFLSLNFLGLLWTELEDKILIDSKTNDENILLSKLIDRKGKENVIKRINFLKKYHTSFQ